MPFLNRYRSVYYSLILSMSIKFTPMTLSSAFRERYSSVSFAISALPGKSSPPFRSPQKHFAACIILENPGDVKPLFPTPNACACFLCSNGPSIRCCPQVPCDRGNVRSHFLPPKKPFHIIITSSSFMVSLTPNKVTSPCPVMR